MPLNDVFAKLSESGSLELIHKETGEILRTLLVRPASQEHRSFILSTWTKSYRPTARRLGVEGLYNKHEPEIAESRWQDCRVLTDEGGFTVYAWVCGQDGGLYHVYVIPELRRIGVCRELSGDVCGKDYDLARPWPYRTSRRVNPYLLGAKRDG